MKISCEIIEDLLPLYIDNVASGESRCLVEEHVAECRNCCRLLEEMKKNEFLSHPGSERCTLPAVKNPPTGAEEARIFQKLRRKISRRRLLSVIAAVLCVTLVYMTGHYLYYDKATYLTWEDSGLSVKDNKLYASKTMDGRLSGIVAPNQKERFIYASETAWIRKIYPERPVSKIVSDYEKEHFKTAADLEIADCGLPGLEKVYYIPPEAIREAQALWDFEDEKEGEKKTEELRKKCLLIWSVEDMEAADSESGAEKEQPSASIPMPEQKIIPRSQKEAEIVGTINESGQWIPPAGSYTDPKTGNILNREGVVIGNDKKIFKPDPNAVG